MSSQGTTSQFLSQLSKSEQIFLEGITICLWLMMARAQGQLFGFLIHLSSEATSSLNGNIYWSRTRAHLLCKHCTLVLLTEGNVAVVAGTLRGVKDTGGLNPDHNPSGASDVLHLTAGADPRVVCTAEMPTWGEDPKTKFISCVR